MATFSTIKLSMDFHLFMAKFAFQMSKCSQTCLFFQGKSQNIKLDKWMKYMFSQSSSRMDFQAHKEKDDYRKEENNNKADLN